MMHAETQGKKKPKKKTTEAWAHAISQLTAQFSLSGAI